MRRSSVLIAIITLYVGVAALTSFYTFRIWGDSSPMVAQAAVLGASTDSSVLATPTPALLGPYPNQMEDSFTGYASQYAVYHVESGTYVLEGGTQGPRPIASTTKMMSAHLVAQHANLDDTVTVSHDAATQIGSLMGIYTNEQFTVRTLLHGMLMVSGNDAAYALAGYTGGILLGNPSAPEPDRIVRFVAEMNSEAARLGMSNTHYADPAGLNDDEGHSTASDLAKIAELLLRDPAVKDIIATPSITVWDQAHRTPYNLDNSNRLVKGMDFPGILGVKTGNTPAAGHCLVAAASRNGQTFIVVVLDANPRAFPGVDSNNVSAVAAGRILEAAFSSVHSH